MPIIVSREHGALPKREKSLNHLMKNPPLNSLKTSHSFLRDDERRQLHSKAADSSAESLSNSSKDARPFVSKLTKPQSNASIASTVSFSVQSSSDKNLNKSVNKSFEKLLEQIAPVGTKLLSATSPSRVSSPLAEETKQQSRLLTKQKSKSEATNKSISHDDLTDIQFGDHSKNIDSNTSEAKNTSQHSTLLADFVNNVKFSNSEPNLSNNLNKTDSTSSANESLLSLLRHSINIHDETDPDLENNVQRYSQYETTFELNFQDISELSRK